MATATPVLGEACSRPEKQRHRSRRAAEKALQSLERRGGIDLGLRPYRCGNHWHLGHRHQTPPLEVQLRRALKFGRTRRGRRRAR